MQEWKNLPENYDDVFSFVYIIRNNHPDAVKKYYIGAKQCKKRVKSKVKMKGDPTKKKTKIRYTDNGVQKYWGSSKELLADIEKFGIEHFEREVIELCNSKFHVSYAELHWQLLSNALFDDRFYNGIINVRLVAPKNFVDIKRDIATLKL